MEKSHRREFLKKSIIGLSGAAFLPGTINSSFNSELQQKIPDLPSRTLGRTGIKTPMISMGSGSANSAGFVKAAYFAGVKLFFSATYYGEGNNEKLVGEGLKDLPRNSFVVGTAAPPDGLDTRTGSLTSSVNVDAYIKKAEGSLSRFGLDYVDIFMVPYSSQKEVVLDSNIIKALQELKKSGKTKYIGLSSHSNCEEVLKAAADSKIYDVVMISYNFKTQNVSSLNDAIAYAAKAGIGVIGMKSTAGAFRDKSRAVPLNSDAALKWVLQNPNISTIVSGMSSLDELKKNIAMIGNIKMTDQEIKDLAYSSSPSEPGLYCQQCRSCIPQCKYNIEIPTIMRSYMYAYGYKDMEHARYALAEAGVINDPCTKCESCSVSCVSGFNIKERISDISRLSGVPKEFLIS